MYWCSQIKNIGLDNLQTLLISISIHPSPCWDSKPLMNFVPHVIGQTHPLPHYFACSMSYHLSQEPYYRPWLILQTNTQAWQLKSPEIILSYNDEDVSPSISPFRIAVKWSRPINNDG